MTAALAPKAGLNGAGGVVKGTVLVVEDDYLLNELLVLMLEAEGYTAIAAHDGASAVQWASVLRPSLITLDLELPLMTGQVVLEALAADEATRRIPVVVFSSDVEGLHPTRQVKRVLMKPQGIDQLVDAVKATLAEPAT